MRVLVKYQLQSPLIHEALHFGIVSDLHNEPYHDILPLLNGFDALLVPGDIVDRYRKSYDNGLSFIREAAERLPVFFSPGNHDLSLPEWKTILNKISALGAEVLWNRLVLFRDCLIGGIYPDEDTAAISEFVTSAEKKQRIWLCHKPEWAACLPAGESDLYICGHAHGGQIRVGHQGIYAPGQGLFPTYTHGWYRNCKMLVSSGAGNPSHMPRWGNPCEVVELLLLPNNNAEERMK